MRSPDEFIFQLFCIAISLLEFWLFMKLYGNEIFCRGFVIIVHMENNYNSI